MYLFKDYGYNIREIICNIYEMFCTNLVAKIKIKNLSAYNVLNIFKNNLVQKTLHLHYEHK